MTLSLRELFQARETVFPPSRKRIPSIISTTFFLTVGLSLWPIIAGLIIGGVIAAPFAAMATKDITDKVLMLLVGCVVVLLSLRTILMTLAPVP